MAKIVPKLAPYEFTPDGQGDDPISFRLKPLTEPQVVDLYSTFDNGQATNATWYRAGLMGIVEVLNCTIELEGKERKAKWPRDRDLIPYALVSACGVDLCLHAWNVSPDGDDDEIEADEKN